jgi:hypothetical protein
MIKPNPTPLSPFNNQGGSDVEEEVLESGEKLYEKVLNKQPKFRARMFYMEK